MMASRALCVIAAALVYRESAWLALGLVIGGAVLPWSAVILANDGPPKRRRAIMGNLLRSSDHALPTADRDRQEREIDG